LVRSHGGYPAVRALRGIKAYQKGEERILGVGNFVEEDLRKSEERLERKFRSKAQVFDFDKVVEGNAGLLEITSTEVFAGGKKR
jgi:hypothetical protein